MRTRSGNGFLSDTRGAAAIEMAILMPLYMIVLFSLLFLGHLTLGMARKEQAVAFAGWMPGTQSAEELVERFYPWVDDPASGAYASGAGGEHEMSIEVLHDRATQASGYPRERVEDIMARMALGDYYQSFSFGAGGVQGRITSNQTEFGRYLTRMNLSHAEGYPISPPPANVVRAVEAFNGPGQERWISGREAALRMRFRPSYIRWAYKDDPREQLTRATYLTGQPREPLGQPELATSFSVIRRGTLQRRGAREAGSSAAQVYSEMIDLMGQDLPAPMDDQFLDNVVGMMGFADGMSIYTPR